jgi:hypothetical protein
MQEFTMA